MWLYSQRRRCWRHSRMAPSSRLIGAFGHPNSSSARVQGTHFGVIKVALGIRAKHSRMAPSSKLIGACFQLDQLSLPRRVYAQTRVCEQTRSNLYHAKMRAVGHRNISSTQASPMRVVSEKGTAGRFKPPRVLCGETQEFASGPHGAVHVPPSAALSERCSSGKIYFPFNRWQKHLLHKCFNITSKKVYV